MSERPILFSGPMVRAILDGRKTQTRRVVKPTPPDYIDKLHGNELSKRAPYTLEDDHGNRFGYGLQDDIGGFYQCRYGKPGDRLWVRETSIIAPKRFAQPDDTCIPDAEGEPRYVQYIATSSDTEAAITWFKLKKTPSIFMPRWASRITLEVVSVRVQRLQDISEDDAKAEGVQTVAYLDHPFHTGALNARFTGERSSHVTEFRNLWQSINGPDSWAQNPWVWVIEFKRLAP